LAGAEAVGLFLQTVLMLATVSGAMQGVTVHS
jgi:hypothetical protein